MAGQKPAAKRSARPPPPPPAASSSEETDSRSRSEESEDEETVAVSPTPAPSKLPPPQQKGNESESSDEEEEGDDEDEEEEAPNKPPAPPRKDEESESSDDEEEGDEEDEEEEEAPKKPPAPPRKDEEPESSDDEEVGEEEEPTHLAAPKKQPPPPQQSKESDVSDEEGEEGESSESDEEAPPPLPPLKQDLEDIKPPPAKKARLAFHRIWSIDDEVRILEALAAHQKQHGALPHPDALISALAGKLDNRAYDSKLLQSKLQSLKKRYVVLRNRGDLPSNEHDRRLLDLSKIVWGGDKTTTAAAAKAGSGHELKSYEEMCELYPYLAEEVRKLEAAHPGMFKRVFGKMNDDKARAMDGKIKKQRVVQMKVELRNTELTKEVTKTIMELVD